MQSMPALSMTSSFYDDPRSLRLDLLGLELTQLRSGAAAVSAMLMMGNRPSMEDMPRSLAGESRCLGLSPLGASTGQATAYVIQRFWVQYF